MIHPSTFSIAAYDPEAQAWGVAVASKFPAVGAVVPWVEAGAGAIATQSYANTTYGPEGLAWMRSGLSAQETLERLLANDPDRDIRQVGLVDVQGKPATFTGRQCYEWAGGLSGEHYAVQGNILAGAGVIQAMAKAYEEAHSDFPARLYAALLAGDQAGGDRRGRQSAAIYVAKIGAGYGGFNDRWIDFRVDDHPDPVARLGELLTLHDLYFGRSEPADRLILGGKVLQNLQQIMQRLGYYRGAVDGEYKSDTRLALTAFIGNENFEDRCHTEEGWIDRPVYEFLLQRFTD